MEENNNVSKNGWKRMFGKKWFFPAVYLTVAALLLTGVLWYQNLENQVPEASEEPQTEMGSDLVEQDDLTGFDSESEPVTNQEEVIKMPVVEESQTQIVTKFFDYDADSEDQENALVLYNNKYYQSSGIDIASSEDEAFEVTASLSGTVSEVKEDPLLGNVVKISHASDLSTYYASLGDVLVEQGAEVKQGDTIGSAGRNIYGQASGTHVHFELRKGDTAVNPEQFFNQPLSDVEAPKEEEEAEEESNSDQQPDQSSEENVTTDPSEDEKEEENSNPSEDDSEEEEPTNEEDGTEEDKNNTNTQTESSAAMANA